MSNNLLRRMAVGAAGVVAAAALTAPRTEAAPQPVREPLILKTAGRLATFIGKMRVKGLEAMVADSAQIITNNGNTGSLAFVTTAYTGKGISKKDRVETRILTLAEGSLGVESRYVVDLRAFGGINGQTPADAPAPVYATFDNGANLTRISLTAEAVDRLNLFKNVAGPDDRRKMTDANVKVLFKLFPTSKSQPVATYYATETLKAFQAGVEELKANPPAFPEANGNPIEVFVSKIAPPTAKQLKAIAKAEKPPKPSASGYAPAF